MAAGKISTDIFMSHDWGVDEVNHNKVKIINDKLHEAKYTTWFDVDKGRMQGNIQNAMARGIEGAKMALVFVTKKYHDKVNGDDFKGVSDNCYLEFQHATNQLTSDKMLSVVMEKDMRNDKNWKGKLGLNMASKMYVDMSGDLNDEKYLNEQMEELKRQINTIILPPNNGNEIAATTTTTTSPAPVSSVSTVSKTDVSAASTTPTSEEAGIRAEILNKSIKGTITNSTEAAMNEDGAEIVYSLAYKFSVKQDVINKIKADSYGGGSPHEAFIGKLRSQNSDTLIEEVNDALEELEMYKAQEVLEEIGEEKEYFNELEEYDVQKLYKFLVFDPRNSNVKSWIDVAQELGMSEDVDEYKEKIRSGFVFSAANGLFTHLKRDNVNTCELLEKLKLVNEDDDMPSTKRIIGLVEEDISKAVQKEEKKRARKAKGKGR